MRGMKDGSISYISAYSTIADSDTDDRVWPQGQNRFFPVLKLLRGAL